MPTESTPVQSLATTKDVDAAQNAKGSLQGGSLSQSHAASCAALIDCMASDELQQDAAHAEPYSRLLAKMVASHNIRHPRAPRSKL